jgi:ribosomal protein S18 acetylase RimI-like enzyme
MPVTTNLDAVRALLNREREWAAYAIGDLSPGLREHCEWHVNDSAVVLLYRGFDPPILFAMGAGDDLRALLDESAGTDVSLHVRDEAIAVMRGIYEPVVLRRMRRMVLVPSAFRGASAGEVREVGEDDLAAVEQLYADGHRRGDAPTHFSGAMLQQGTFRGICEDGAVVAVAGTHLYSVEMGVCAVGNVYTRHDRRGRGLGASVTSAVVQRALDDGIRTIVLNVGEHNLAAQRVYERLGFSVYCDFYEGEASRLAAAGNRVIMRR